ncbi:hypothetical protein ACHAXT_004885 [Thalassiosira profunda]
MDRHEDERPNGSRPNGDRPGRSRRRHPDNAWVGQNFFVNGSAALGAADQLDEISFSSLSGTLSQVVGGRCGGLSLQDVENAGGDAGFDDDTTICPERDALDYVHALNPNLNMGQEASGAIFRAGVGVPVVEVRQKRVSANPNDAPSEGSAHTDERSQTTGGGSSLSSLTNDFAVGRKDKKQLVPKFDEKGKFAAFGRKTGKKGKGGKSSPNSSQAQLHLGGSPSFDKQNAPDPNAKPSKRPWFMASPHARESPNSPARTHATHSNTRSDQSLSTPPSSPASDKARQNQLGKDFLTSQEHVDSLVRFPPNLPPPIPMDKRVQSMDSHGRSEGYTNDTSMRSMGFGDYVAHKIGGTSRRRKVVLLFAVAMLLVCVAAIVAAAFGGGSDGGDAIDSAEEMESVEEEGSIWDQEYWDEQTVVEGEDDTAAMGDAPELPIEPIESTPSLEDGAEEFVSDEGIPVNDESATSENEEEEPTNGEPATTESEEGKVSSGPGDEAVDEDTPPFDGTAVEIGIPGAAEEEAPLGPTPAEGANNPPTTPFPTEPSDPFEGVDTSAWANYFQRPTRKPTPPRPWPQPTNRPTNRPTPRPSTRNPTSNPSRRPTPRPIAPTATVSDTVYLSPVVDTSTFRNRPDKSFQGHSYLSVKGGGRSSSYLRFNLSSLRGQRVAQAVLRLYSVNGEAGGLGQIDVDMLPNAGIWAGNDVTWDNPVQSAQAYTVGSFSALGYDVRTDLDASPTLHEVDVTGAFRGTFNALDSFGVVTFELFSSIESPGRVDFASSEYSGRLRQANIHPELVIVRASSGDVITPNPSISPTTAGPSPFPTDIPTTDRPTRRPTRKPTKKPTTKKPTRKPTRKPTKKPVVQSDVPSKSPVNSPTTASPITPMPSDRPTKSPEESTTTTSTTTTTTTVVETTSTTTTRWFEDCPASYSASSLYISDSYATESGTGRVTVYQCILKRCDAQNPAYTPGGHFAELGGWMLVGECDAPETPKPSTAAPVPPPTTRPSPAPTTPNPTGEPTPRPVTNPPSPNPTPEPSPPPTPEPSDKPTPKPSPSPTPDPTPDPTPGPTKSTEEDEEPPDGSNDEV